MKHRSYLGKVYGFLTRFGPTDSGESVPDMSRIVDRQSSSQNDNNRRRDLDGQSPKVHQTEQIDQRESDAGEDPKDGHQIGNEDQRNTNNSSHCQTQITDQFTTNNL